MTRPVERIRAFVRAHRLAVILGAVALLFFLIGATAPRSTIPLMCKIYG